MMINNRMINILSTPKGYNPFVWWYKCKDNKRHDFITITEEDLKNKLIQLHLIDYVEKKIQEKK